MAQLESKSHLESDDDSDKSGYGKGFHNDTLLLSTDE